MKVLLVFHGWFPRSDRPVPGGGLRAWHHAEALRGAGHEVVLVTREQDRLPGGPATFASGPELRRLATEVAPDAILCVQPEEAPSVAGLGIPVVVDLYAPRLLEAQFEDRTGEEAVRTLRAIEAGDAFLFSNPRQRDFYLGLLVMAGVDARQDGGMVVPLAAVEGPQRRTKKPPRIVFGGVAWPWQDPVEALGRAVRHLERRGTGCLVILGGPPAVGTTAVPDLRTALPEGPYLHHAGVLPYPELLKVYAEASAALDWMSPTPERSMAVSFRDMDYLGCALPIITHCEHPLADLLRASGAGLVSDSVEEALDTVLTDPGWRRRMEAARDLALSRFSREVCEAPLLAWLESPRLRERQKTPMGTLAEALDAVGQSRWDLGRATVRIAAYEAEIIAKRTEMADAVGRIQQLMDVTARLSGAVAEVAGFKQEAIQVLGRGEELARREAGDLGRELGIVRADVAKKTAELKAMEDEQRRLENDLEHARLEIERLRKRRFLPG